MKVETKQRKKAMGGSCLDLNLNLDQLVIIK